MARGRTTSKAKEVEAFRHNDTRVNIPTEELRNFVQDDEDAPDTLLYPRDPSLDPQLVWKGKDEQDRADLDVPVVPVYIQEKIHPRAIIDDLHNVRRGGPCVLPPGEQGGTREETSSSPTTAGEQLDLFADFNGMEDDFSKQIEFYQHEQHWSNRLILGDSLLVMASLAEKEGLKGKVQTIYLDPPYGIKFGSNWQVSTRKRDVRDGRADDATRQPEQVKAFRDTWKLGIHSYLAYLRDRFVVARDLLTESGSIFVQIGDENVHLVRSVLDEVFGSENCAGMLFVAKTTGFGETKTLPAIGDYILWYSKLLDQLKYRQLFEPKTPDSPFAREYRYVESPDGSVRRPLTKDERTTPSLVPEGWKRYRPDTTTSQGATASGGFEVQFDGRVYRTRTTHHWKTSREGMQRLAYANRLLPRDTSLSYLRYLDDFPVVALNNNWMDLRWGFDAGDKSYVVETNPGIVERCLLMTTDPGDLVLDPTCGSGTTAYVAEQWGRRWITIDTSRVALALARTRLMAARYPYYVLADSREGQQKEAELTGIAPDGPRPEGDIRKGFVYKRVPHITLKSIANNPDIREGMSREEIDKAIARHSDTETLYDQPYEGKDRVRVSGPFTVESLSPHRVLSTADDNLDGDLSASEIARQDDFAEMVLGYLAKTPIQNTVRDERMKLEHLQPHPGRYINATGEYTDAEGAVRRVAISLGPEHGTVGPSQVREAAKEAMRGQGYDVLLVCGFAFDAHVSQEAKEYGPLPVLSVRMSTDLTMGDDLLKKTGSGNLFMVFGEPDVDLIPQDDGRLVVSIKGVDVYDPTTGTVRSDSPDEIACWFIDTAYNEESFFVRHAYFTGADKPYEKLQRALRAEIDEDAWASLYRTESRPFPVPDTGKIAVKVINHFGDEVMKVFEV